MLPKGTILGHYRILGRIGVGGMGEVYVAEDTSIERRVAIKVVRAEPQTYLDAAEAQEASRLFTCPLFLCSKLLLLLPFRCTGSRNSLIFKRAS